MKKNLLAAMILTVIAFLPSPECSALSDVYKGNIYNPGTLKPTDSVLRVRIGDQAPDFSLKSIAGEMVSLSQFRGRKNVVISFVPAAWTPVCSDQWPGYNILRDDFNRFDAVLLGITVDNIPTLFSWTNQMGGPLWFPVLSDFWPHGATAERYGVLRSDGVAERAIFIVDKKGVIRFIDVSDINRRPPLEEIFRELEKLKK
jgi:peroxiredoxin